MNFSRSSQDIYNRDENLLSNKTHPKEEVVGNYFNRRIIIMAIMVIFWAIFFLFFFQSNEKL
jgi:hypothetical protein